MNKTPTEILLQALDDAVSFSEEYGYRSHEDENTYKNLKKKFQSGEYQIFERGENNE
jgi:hypothetical protein